jgi:hypothetical protein
MAFVIGGHPRSGTTMLYRMFRRHPAFGITGELKCFSHLGEFPDLYLSNLQNRWYRKSFLGRIGRRAPWKYRIQSGVFLMKYHGRIRWTVRNRPVTYQDVVETLQNLFQKEIVGDKNPQYIFDLQALVEIPTLTRIMIYRDGRDVVSSFLRNVRTIWKDLAVAQTLNTPDKIAESWALSIQCMERYQDSLFAIRYEDFARNPAPTLFALALHFNVAPELFKYNEVHDASIGKFKTYLSSVEQNEVMRVAGDTLSRLGYLD